MMTDLSKQREHLALLLSMIVMVLLTLNFATHHTLNQPFEQGYIVSGVLFAILTLYFRYFPPEINVLYKALYRIAIAMTFWSFGLFFFPTQDLVLYLISLPAFYFLYRIEVKETVQNEDLIVCGLLLGLATLCYFLQRPIQAYLFDLIEINAIDYFTKAPLLMLTGAGFVRLYKHSQWKNMCLLGTVVFLFGAILSLSLFVKYFSNSVVISAVVVTHLFMLFMLEKSPTLRYFKSFCGMVDKEIQQYISMVWTISFFLMQFCVIYLLVFSVRNIAVVPLSFIALLFSLYRYSNRTLSLFLVECLLLFLMSGLVLFPQIHIVWQILSAVVLFGCVVIRRNEKWASLLGNRTILLLIILYYIQFSGNIALNYIGLIFSLLPAICWMVIPGRPLPIAKKNHWAVWPFLSAVVMIFVSNGYSARLITSWALVIIVPPSILYVFLTSRFSEPFIKKYRLNFLDTWRANGKSALIYLAIASVLVAATGFALNYQWFVNSWTGIVQAEIVLLTGVFVFLYMVISGKSSIYIVHAEFLIWATIGLLRWKFDILGTLNFGSPIDGYFLIAAAVFVAGIREVSRKKMPEFASYFQKTTTVYGVLGWLYLQALQFVHTGEAISFRHHGEMGSLLMALLNFRLSKTIKRSNLIYSFIFTNAAILLFFYQKEYSNLLFYVLPSAGSAMVLVQLFKDSLTPLQVKNIRLTITLIICGTSGFYNIIDFNESLWYPVLATLISSGGVLLGISLRIRIYLYMGMVFFLVNSAAVIGHIIINQPQENMLVSIALLFLLGGIPLIAMFVILQIKRQQILDKYRLVMGMIGEWE